MQETFSTQNVERLDLFANLSQILLYSLRLDNTRTVCKDFLFLGLSDVTISNYTIITEYEFWGRFCEIFGEQGRKMEMT